MSDEWNFYESLVNGDPAFIFLDMGIAGSAPLEGYGEQAYVRVRMLHPNVNGLSSRLEYDDLCALEDSVTAEIFRRTSSIYVGRNTSAGNRDFYFYTADSADFEIAAKKAMAAFPTYTFDVGGQADPAWRVYFDFLYPSPISRQQMANRSVVENLAKHGDQLDQPRRIDHMVIFTNSAQCEAFSEFVVQLGYTISEGSPTRYEGEICLEFSNVGKPAEIDDVTIPLFEAALAHGGEFDGWGCNVVG